MKTILLILLIITSSLSQELLTYTKAKRTYKYCVEDYYYQDNRLYFIKSSYPYRYYSINLSQYSNVSFESGYIYEYNECKINDKNINNYTTVTTSHINYRNLTELGLSKDDFNFLMALSGICISFLFLFGLFRWI